MKKVSALPANPAPASPYLILVTTVAAWTKGQKLNICPLSGQNKHPSHWMSTLEFEQLEGIENGLGAKATYEIRSLYMDLLREAQEKKIQPVDVAVMDTFAHDLLSKAPGMTHAEMMIIMEAEFGTKKGIKLIARRALAQYVKPECTEPGLGWEEIIRSKTDEDQNTRLKTAKEMHHCVLAEKQRREFEARDAMATQVFERHKAMARGQDLTKNSHDLANILCATDTSLSFKKMVAAIIAVRNEQAELVVAKIAVRKNQAALETKSASQNTTPFFDRTPNLLKESVKNPGSSRKKSKVPRATTKTATPADKKKQKKNKGR
jgi:hypothetical protein